MGPLAFTKGETSPDPLSLLLPDRSVVITLVLVVDYFLGRIRALADERLATAKQGLWSVEGAGGGCPERAGTSQAGSGCSATRQHQ